jgi:hypothetical protein
LALSPLDPNPQVGYELGTPVGLGECLITLVNVLGAATKTEVITGIFGSFTTLFRFSTKTDDDDDDDDDEVTETNFEDKLEKAEEAFSCPID